MLTAELTTETELFDFFISMAAKLTSNNLHHAQWAVMEMTINSAVVGLLIKRKDMDVKVKCIIISSLREAIVRIHK